MKIKFAVLLAALFTTSCATQKLVETTSDRLFPFGVYEQRIVITPDNPIKNAQAFRGILSLQKQKIEVAGLSPFGNTVFRILEEGTEPVKTDVFVKELAQFKERINDYYFAMRSVLNTARVHPLPSEMVVQMKSGPKNLKITKYDGSGIPKEFGFATEAHKITVTVLSYELAK
jgi:hypothetical protein